MAIKSINARVKAAQKASMTRVKNAGKVRPIKNAKIRRSPK